MSNEEDTDPTREHKSEDEKDDGDDDDSDQRAKGRELAVRISYYQTVLIGGDIAALTAFEPRLLRCSIPECSWGVLKELVLSMERMNLSLLAMEMLQGRALLVDDDEVRSFLAVGREAADRLGACAASLAAGKPVGNFDSPDDGGSDDAARAESGSRGLETLGGDEESPSSSKSEPELEPFDPFHLGRYSREVSSAADRWLEVMGRPDQSASGRAARREGAGKAVIANGAPWILASTGVMLDLLRVLLVPFRRETWVRIFKPPFYDLPKFAWAVKFAAGFTALVCMTVYWDAYKRLEIPVSGYPVGAHFAGWNLIAYSAATTQTVEGTVKKGLLRAVGTCCGGFGGWLALTWCGTSIPGHVAWLTVTTAIASYVGSERGVKARMGLSKDFGWFPMYYAMTQSLVVFTVLTGGGGKEEIAVNRIIANLTGVAMAIVMAVIPPGVYGGDPKYAKTLLRKDRELTADALRVLLEPMSPDDDEEFGARADRIDKHRMDALPKIKVLRNEAKDLSSDAGQFHRLPYCKVDPNLPRQLQDIISLGAAMFTMLGFCSEMLREKELRGSFLPGTKEHDKLQDLLGMLDSDSWDETKEDSGIVKQERPEPGVLFVHFVDLAVETMRRCDNALSSIQWGIISR